MSEILIKVRGSHSVEVSPELGVVVGEIRSAGASAEVVMERLRQGLAQVREKLERLEADGAVDRFVIQQVRTYSHQTGSKESNRLAVVHRAVVGLWVEFVDFDQLAVWVGRSATEDGYKVNGISWRLTKETRSTTEREVRQEAVRQAKVRAQDYADALELGPVAVRSINDVGMRPEISYAAASMPMPPTGMGGAPGAAAPELAFDPDDITIGAEVEAAFTVTPEAAG